MSTEQMNVHKALSEVKILNSRINKEINAVNFCMSNVVTNTKICGKDKDNWMNDVKAQYQSIEDLIKRRNAIKRAVNQSNAETTINVGDATYTIAAALEMKVYGLNYYNELIKKLRDDYNSANKKVELINAEADIKATTYATQLIGGDSKSSEVIKQVDVAREKYLEQHKAEILDPVGVLDKIAALEKFVDEFTSNVDSAISVSNATTIITVEY